MKLTAIFDIDGVLADNSETWWLDCGIPQQRLKFGSLIKTAAPLPACHILRALAAQGARIYIFTARSREVRPETEDWLHKHELSYYELIMRQPENEWEACDLKKSMLEAARRASEGEDMGTVIAFEDCARCAKMYEDNDVKTFLACNLRDMLKW
jgi:hypothetical protein